MKILIPRAFSHFREHKPSCEIRLICSCCRCAHSGSVSFPPPNRQSLKSVQSLNCIETLNFHEGNDILYHLQGQLASGFKPRSREGNDYTQGNQTDEERRSFNPRSHEGNDVLLIILLTRRHGFNPRSREGNDTGDFEFFIFSKDVSIHVPARGTTSKKRHNLRLIREFQSTFPRGERLITDYYMEGEKACFNPRSREGNDVVRQGIIFGLNVFQSTFPRGERQDWRL